jgi:hypothetical protein
MTATSSADRVMGVVLEDASQLLLGGLGDDLGRRATLGEVHPHVERGILRVRESAFGAVELQRRDPEVEEHALHFIEAL